jgi:hypothetical protein
MNDKERPKKKTKQENKNKNLWRDSSDSVLLGVIEVPKPLAET